MAKSLIEISNKIHRRILKPKWNYKGDTFSIREIDSITVNNNDNGFLGFHLTELSSGEDKKAERMHLIKWKRSGKYYRKEKIKLDDNDIDALRELVRKYDEA